MMVQDRGLPVRTAMFDLLSLLLTREQEDMEAESILIPPAVAIAMREACLRGIHLSGAVAHLVMSDSTCECCAQAFKMIPASD